MQEHFWFTSQYQGNFGYAHNEIVNIKLDMQIINVAFLVEALNKLNEIKRIITGK